MKVVEESRLCGGTDFGVHIQIKYWYRWNSTHNNSLPFVIKITSPTPERQESSQKETLLERSSIQNLPRSNYNLCLIIYIVSINNLK